MAVDGIPARRAEARQGSTEVQATDWRLKAPIATVSSGLWQPPLDLGITNQELPPPRKLSTTKVVPIGPITKILCRRYRWLAACLWF
jgi:hypothetical protein